jgi:hypothetical protein
LLTGVYTTTAAAATPTAKMTAMMANSGIPNHFFDKNFFKYFPFLLYSALLYIDLDN